MIRPNIPANIPVYRGNLLHDLLERFSAAKAARKEAKRLEAEARDAILAAMNGRPALRVGERIVRARAVAGSPGTTITAAMLGQVLPGRRGFLALDVIPAADTAAEPAP